MTITNDTANETSTNTSTMTATAAGAAPVMSDPRPNFAEAVRLGRAIVAAIRPDQLDLPTPCAEFDVRRLRGHLLAVLNRVAVLGGGGDVWTTPLVIDIAADTDVDVVYAGLAAATAETWRDDAVLGRTISLPWAELPGAVMLMTYINEVSVHSWDLATATGQTPQWDDDVLTMAYETIRRGLPAGGRTPVGAAPSEQLAPFAPVVAVADDSPLIDRLVAWNGRQP